MITDYFLGNEKEWSKFFLNRIYFFGDWNCCFPSDDEIDIAAVSFFSDVTVTRLFIAPTTARVP